jgi:hypothetical protein
MGKSSIGRWSKLENVQHQGDLLVSVHLPRQYSELGRNHREDRSVCDHSQAQMDPTGYPSHIRVIVHCLQMFEDIENVLQSGCALSTASGRRPQHHSLHPPHQSTMMAYQLTKHALCLVIPEAVGSKLYCGTKT